MVVVLKEIAQSEVLSGVFSQSLITVVAGVFVFAISQWIMVTEVHLHQEYLKAASGLSCEILKLSQKYNNFSLTVEEEFRIKDANAEYLAAAWNSGWLCRRRRRKNAFLVAQSVNGIASLRNTPLNIGKRDLELVMSKLVIKSRDRNLIIEYRQPDKAKKMKAMITKLKKMGN